ncbi:MULTISPECIES: NYN domain-containing protein [Saccharibacter]|nr:MULTISPECIES: NYN domain-containing protein [Saccharibacter]MXV36133.1 NYN domain-containing protein [Saccharibacter sp. EH611]MXV56992.1 NYN domain-containing protein [Saccharibacter sp. EH70]MXV66648.1 NYN domain-containing protein [Saccharibacter sp. EH60]
MSNLLLRSNDRTSLFINGASLHHAARNLGFEVDFLGLRALFERSCMFQRAFYYAAMPETEDYSPLRPLTDWLAYNGYHLVTKTAREFTSHSGQRRVKGNMNVELAVDLMEQAPHLDHAVIISGDSDLRRAVEAIQAQGTRVTVISSVRTTPPMIGDDLRRQTDHFVELSDIAHRFTRRNTDPRAAAAGPAPDVRPRGPIRHPADYDDDEDED